MTGGITGGCRQFGHGCGSGENARTRAQPAAATTVRARNATSAWGTAPPGPPKQPLNLEKREAASRGLEPRGGLARVLRGNTLYVRYEMRRTKSTCCGAWSEA